MSVDLEVRRAEGARTGAKGAPSPAEREEAIASLVRRHGLPADLAAKVADREMALARARATAAARKAGATARRPLSRGEIATWCTLAAALVCGTFFTLTRDAEGPLVVADARALSADAPVPDRAAPRPPTAEVPRPVAVEKDGAGEAVLLRGPDPISVLAECARQLRSRGLVVDIVGLAEAAPAQPGARRGLLTVNGEPRQVTILADPVRRAWTAGQGRPLEPVPVEPPVAAEEITPVGR